MLDPTTLNVGDLIHVGAEMTTVERPGYLVYVGQWKPDKEWGQFYNAEDTIRHWFFGFEAFPRMPLIGLCPHTGGWDRICRFGVLVRDAA